MSTQHNPNITRRHENGEHNRWCHQVRGTAVYCKFTGKLLRRAAS